MIAQELARLREEFASISDGFGRYSYLTELSALLPAAGEDVRTPENLYPGCQSRVWLRAWREGDRFHLADDSDALVIRGVLYLFWALLDGRGAEEVGAADFDLLSELGIGEHFNSRRAAGIAGLLGELQRGLSA